MNEAIDEIIQKMQEIKDDPDMQDGWAAWIEPKVWLNEKQNKQNQSIGN
jgi:hypothetical protein